MSANVGAGDMSGSVPDGGASGMSGTLSSAVARAVQGCVKAKA